MEEIELEINVHQVDEFIKCLERIGFAPVQDNLNPEQMNGENSEGRIKETA